MEKKPNHFRRRLAALAVSLVLAVVCVPSALAVDLSVDAGFYFKQSRGGTCTLASAAMMLRRRAYLDGLGDWFDVTENSVHSTAWMSGLSHSFTYKEMQVGYAVLPSSLSEKTQTLIRLLEQHPEGIVIYDRSKPHAILLTDYTDGVFYCADPAGSVSAGRVPISQASVSIAGVSCYWYICSDSNSLSVSSDGLRLEGMRYPIQVRTGSAVTLTGTACSSAGATLTEVQVAILDAMDQTVQSASALPNAASFSFREVDSQIRFGELAPGEYTYLVLLTDSTGQTLCFVSDFTVSSAATSTASYWSAQDTAGEKLVQVAQDAARDLGEDTTSPAAESSLSWLTAWLGL